jgi:ABC-type Zn2+ transport system substrate-binding protein/surface adhesin
MVSRLMRKWVLAAALAVMPLHGVAAALAILLCHGDAEVHAMHVSAAQGHDHEGHSHDAGHQHDHGVTSDDDSGGSGNFFHLCCNLTASVLPTVNLSVTLPDFPVHVFVPDPLHDLFIPDRPQRPPLA